MSYYVYTWDGTLEQYTPQKGVRCGPYRSLASMRPALRKLANMGYTIDRHDAFCVLVTNEPEHDPRTRRQPHNQGE